MASTSSVTSSRTVYDDDQDYPLYTLASAKTTRNTHKSILVIGSGAAGLVTAQTLIKDGFTSVNVFSQDSNPGGVWEHSKVYSGVFINNLYGDYRFSSLEMPRHPSRDPKNNRLSAEDMQFYFEKFTDTYLRDRITYNTQVLNIRRPKPPFHSDPPNWVVSYRTKGKDEVKEMGFHRIVLCTGGCHKPRIPKAFSPAAVQASGFRGPVIHSSEFRRKLDTIFNVVKPAGYYTNTSPETDPYLPKSNHEGDSESESDDPGVIVVIGGGKSAQDIAAYLANEGHRRNVCMVYEKTDAFMASSSQLSDRVRKSRLLGVLSPHSELRTPIERFLHKTWLGEKIVRGLFQMASNHSFKSFQIPLESPLRLAQEPFWSLRVNDEVCRRGNSFHVLAMKGQIHIEAPVRAVGFGKDGRSLVLSDGKIIRADAVVLATGYESSWADLFDAQTMNHVGLGKYPPQYNPLDAYNEEWQGYTSLEDPPAAAAANKQWISCIYRGIVPARNIMKRDLAINGAVFSTNNGYVFETTSHWISSYFLEDPFLEVPASVKEAIQNTERTSAWLRRRYPDMLHWTNESHSSDIQFWSWPQYTDDLLRDMNLTYGKARTGGNSLTWLLKPIEIDAIKHLGKERAALRMQSSSV
ncbi:FAD/NAD(P)-binding domain-containing protein [Gymnopus androsaceus JB14]|uniref:FAD/NAD(P)-binding domain-containing protein n=1 Tax=Gymnopus androsaceus JB14 TaxID=1447944 RepID=A0A6A4GWY6_9AGAR|nr:FAD/NAD(P)-binding domain-containing protein [Gymnopus androsaceus JB14]